MKFGISYRIFLFSLVLVFIGYAFFVRPSNRIPSKSVFVGKWQSSRLATPLYLYENGEWEIKDDDNRIMQYGIWEYRNGQIIWISKVNGLFIYDANTIISANENRFSLRENFLVSEFVKIE
jgi:hypothetical protein